MHIYKLSLTYGEYGLMKKIARRAIPKVIKNYPIILLKKNYYVKNRFDILPLYGVDYNAIVSKIGDINVAYKVQLLELFTLSNEEYEAFHHAWIKAIKVLTPLSRLHKQDCVYSGKI